jgi:hypothetical protein
LAGKYSEILLFEHFALEERLPGKDLPKARKGEFFLPP